MSTMATSPTLMIAGLILLSAPPSSSFSLSANPLLSRHGLPHTMTSKASHARAIGRPLGGLSCAFESQGLVLQPKSDGEGWWDDRTAAMPVVLPPSEKDGRSVWRMFYYGRDAAEWSRGRPAFLPTGVVGLAESDDGLTWRRVRGPLAKGAILLPSESDDDWDAVQIGVSDVVHSKEEGYTMHYFGGSTEKMSFGPGPEIAGFRMRCGVARSSDGLTWVKDSAPTIEPTKEEGGWDSVFASWPRVVPVEEGKEGGDWLVTYHALQPPQTPGGPRRWAAGTAISKGSKSAAENVEKVGKVIEGGGEGSWDVQGVGTRHVIHHDGALCMVYEAVDAKGGHSIGLATSTDGGKTWKKDESVPGKSEPGGPVFEARVGVKDAWDNGVVGTPFVCKVPGGGYRLYYVGCGKDSKGENTVAIGCAESVDGSLKQWRRVLCTVENPIY